MKTQTTAGLTSLSSWHRSKRGNLWRHYDGCTLTIFGRDDGRYSWCIAGPRGPRFSSATYPNQRKALRAIAVELDHDFDDD